MAKKAAQKKARVRVAQKQKQKQNSTQGGKEVTLLGHALRTLGGMGGGALGGFLGNSSAGAAVGSSLGATISRWLGSGDYSVAQNSIVAKASTGVPLMHKTGQSIVVRHKEFVCEVNSAVNFTVQRSFVLNPGLVQTFPWLSRLASNFQEYQIRGLVFHYVPTSGSVSGTNGALGSVMLTTSYRSNDSVPASKVELLNEYWAGESIPSEAFVHPVECAPQENPFNIHYVRSGPVPAGDNQLLYDVGTTHLCVGGAQAAGVSLGDLWVTYEVELKKPVVDSNVTQSPGWSAQLVSVAPTGSVFGATAITATYGNVPIVAQTSTITIPVGYFGVFYFQVIMFYDNPTTAVYMGGQPTTSNCSMRNLADITPAIAYTSVNNGTASSNSYYIHSFCVLKPTRDISATITLPSMSSTAGTLTRSYVIMTGSTD